MSMPACASAVPMWGQKTEDETLNFVEQYSSKILITVHNIKL